jgi:hypothetical protein
MGSTRRSLMVVMPLALVFCVLVLAPAGQAQVSATSPDRRSSFGLAPDANGNMVLFGGSQTDPSGNFRRLGDTWTWDGTTWTERQPESSPEPRCCFAMAYDPVRQQTVLFGGYDDETYLDDTWTWDGTTWTEQNPDTVPPAQHGPGMAFDARAGQMVMLSGFTDYFPLQSLTWTWDGSDWTRQSPRKSPLFRERMGMAYDAAGGEVVVFGGEYPSFEWQEYRNDTLSWVWTKWAWHNPEFKPTKRSTVGIAYDAGLRKVVMFGGTDSDDTTYLWDGRTWSRADPPTSPRPRWAPGMAWDPTRGQVVLFGGRQYRHPWGYRDFGDTWIWDGTDWKCLLGCPP